MLKRTYAPLLPLWDAFHPSAHASQVEVNKQTGAQNAAAVGTGNAVFQDLDQGSY